MHSMRIILTFVIVFFLIFISCMWYQKRRFQPLKKILMLDFLDFNKAEIVVSILFTAFIAIVLSLSAAIVNVAVT